MASPFRRKSKEEKAALGKEDSELEEVVQAELPENENTENKSRTTNEKSEEKVFINPLSVTIRTGHKTIFRKKEAHHVFRQK